MKCPICKGPMKIAKDKMDNIEYEMHKCLKCNEEILDSKQLKYLARAQENNKE